MNELRLSLFACAALGTLRVGSLGRGMWVLALGMNASGYAGVVFALLGQFEPMVMIAIGDALGFLVVSAVRGSSWWTRAPWIIVFGANIVALGRLRRVARARGLCLRGFLLTPTRDARGGFLLLRTEVITRFDLRTSGRDTVGVRGASGASSDRRLVASRLHVRIAPDDASPKADVVRGAVVAAPPRSVRSVLPREHRCTSS